EVERHVETIDNTPNRFVKHALEQWSALLGRIEAILEREEESATRNRGLREVQEVAGTLNTVLGHPMFREIGPMARLPAENTVLQSKEGYRDVWRAYWETEAAGCLAWEGGDEVFGAGKRDVAQLYEYWVFLGLARLVSSLCGSRAMLDALVTKSDSGW